jgi:hypothetical protein
MKNKNTALSEQFHNPIEKLDKKAKPILLTDKYTNVYFPGGFKKSWKIPNG